MLRDVSRLLPLLPLLVFVFLVAACGGPAPATDGGVDGDRPLERCELDEDCGDSLYCTGVERCAPSEPAADARGCVLAESPCLASQRCVEGARRCESVCSVAPDADGDGHDAIECGGDDCDDADRNRFPGNGEICDPSHDEDCDPTTFGLRDADGDDVISDECCNVIDGVSTCGTDCNDSVASVYPGATEICDGLDGDCNGVLDGPGEDDDGDGRADNACAGRGGTDCNDEDPTVYLGAPEICDGKDNDCAEGGVDGEDLDRDGQVPPDAACEGGPFPRTDCDDGSADAYGGATEICNGGDDDCDGTADETVAADAACTAIVGRGVGLCSEAECYRLRCDAGWADCDRAVATGCETDLTTSTASCGGCGIACADGARCMDGQCESPLRVVATGDHTCALFPSGALSCWGSGRFGQLGSGVTDDVLRPRRVLGLAPARAVAGNSDSTCVAVDPDGSVWCWGRSQPPIGSLVPAPLPGAPIGVVELSAQEGHYCARTSSGEVWCWGANTYGQLGDGTTIDRAMPVRITVPAGVVQVAAGSFGTCVRLASGQVWCWGLGSSGGLGNGGTANSLVPVRVGTIADATDVAYGAEAGCVVRASGELWCWGANVFTPIVGDGSGINRPSPVRTGTFADAVDVEMGSYAACVVRRDGRAMCWGSNVGGVLGDGGGATERTVPVFVSGLTDASSVSVATVHACAIVASGAVTCWGGNAQGQLGDGARIGRPFPGRTLGAGDIVEMAGGSEHACALDSLGGVSCAGDDRFGQRGDGAGFGAPSTVPTRVASLTSAVAITSGPHHACALRVDGTVGCWGSNAFGQLGDGGTDHGSCGHPTAGPSPTDCSAAPVTVAGLSDVVQVAAGAWSTCALRRSGGVVCWGDGALGNGSAAMPPTPPDTCRRSVFGLPPQQTRCALAPVDVIGVGDAVELAVGTSHACARRAGGTVVCWGSNISGELGDGTRASADVPVAVRDVRGAIAIAAAAEQTCALIDDGTMRCWGGSVAVPIAVAGLTDVASLSGGGDQICIVRTGGEAGCFAVGPEASAPATLTTGAAAIFRDGFEDRALPPSIPPIGGQLTCVRPITGAVSCRGDNDGGQLADGTTTERTTLTRWRLR